MPGPTPVRYQPRPISPQDNPLTTGLPVNPNGTYIANPYPTTAAAGAQGGYGAMLPQVQVGPSRMPQYSGPAGQIESYNVNAFLSNILPNIFNTLQSYGPRAPTTPYITAPTVQPPPSTRPSPTVAPGSFQESQQGRFNIPSSTVPTYTQSSGRPDPGLIYRIAQNPQEFASLAPTQQEAVQRLLEQGVLTPGGGGGNNQQGGGGGSGNSDFMNTRFMQENTRNNVAFENQLRWDPERRRYVQIGTLLREGRLNNRTGRMQRPRRGGGGNRDSAPSGPSQTRGGFTGSFGVVNFNTGSG